jgi:molecular chaperone GrpE
LAAKADTLTQSWTMAKNLTDRVRKIFRPMAEENTINEEQLPNDTTSTVDEQTGSESAEQTSTTETTTESASEGAAEWRDKYLRLYAEFDNFRKRTMKERAELLSTASADVIKEMLPILDDFDRAVKANETVEDITAVKEGFVLIHHKLYKKLEMKGLKPIQAKDQAFDTDYHEAITQIPAPTEDLKGKVVDEVEKGYMLNEKIIRFSKVVIGQ